MWDYAQLFYLDCFFPLFQFSAYDLPKKITGSGIYYQNSTCTEFHYYFSLFWDANLVLFFLLKELGTNLFIFQRFVYFCDHSVNTSLTQPP